MPKTASKTTLLQRQQVAEAVLMGYLDSAVAGDLTTAKNNGYRPGQFDDAEVTNAAIAGINR